ncbi:MAG: alkaline phosphatase family protein [Victivallales bacterium]|nr:alkaline phosphatase family protein [Victivallales bacterium]
MIMIMVDGLGVPPERWENSVYAKLGSKEFADVLSRSIPLDACLGVEGVPQSATGQTALFTGVNAPREIGGHVQGFPGPSLRSMIRKRNIFSELKSNGFSPTFANAYVKHTVVELAEMRMRSVTTIMADSALGNVRTADDLVAGNAVYHDLTRASVVNQHGIDRITPETAAEHLAEIAVEHDFTLFEYFMTDRAGHKSDEKWISAVLAEFSAFFLRLLKLTKETTAILLTSDHGNIESPDTRGHTTNPVPLFTNGVPASKFANARSITDVLNVIIKYLLKSP